MSRPTNEKMSFEKCHESLKLKGNCDLSYKFLIGVVIGVVIGASPITDGFLRDRIVANMNYSYNNKKFTPIRLL